MKKSIAFLLFALPCLALAQSPVYQPFEVDTAARPQGGVKGLDAFLLANLRKSTTAIAENFTGRVTVTGVAEPNGRITDVRLVNSLRPDCDREALRIFALFKAWKPARKDGQSVRQQVTYQVLISPGPTIRPFYYANGIQTEYLNMGWLPVADTASQQAQHKVVMAVGEDWLPTGDMIHYKRTLSGAWKPSMRFTLAKEELTRRTATGKRIYRIGHVSPAKQWFGYQTEIDEDGKWLRTRRFVLNHDAPQQVIVYAENGMQLEVSHYEDIMTINGLVPSARTTRWYPNGQFHESITRFPTKAIERIYLLCDADGNRIVDSGGGDVVRVDSVPSRADSTKITRFRQAGSYLRLDKQGRWTGVYEDGSYAYEEDYSGGVLTRGKAKKAGSDTIRYTVLETLPVFRGGAAALTRFIRKNRTVPAGIRPAPFPVDVVVRFTVRPDGTTADYAVIESASPVADAEALRLARATSEQWKPATRRGEAISTTMTLPIHFAPD